MMVYLVYNKDLTDLLDVIELNKEEKIIFEKENKNLVLLEAKESGLDFDLEELEEEVW